MVETNNRKSVMINLNKISPMYKDTDFIELTEWSNGEGWDINISDKKIFNLHYDELTAINFLSKYLDCSDKIKLVEK